MGTVFQVKAEHSFNVFSHLKEIFSILSFYSVCKAANMQKGHVNIFCHGQIR